jgi:hypothetical protein
MSSDESKAVLLALLDERTKNNKEQIDRIIRLVTDVYVKKDDVKTMQKQMNRVTNLVYGVVGVILSSIIGLAITWLSSKI